jgi:hypothetical protein
VEREREGGRDGERKTERENFLLRLSVGGRKENHTSIIVDVGYYL